MENSEYNTEVHNSRPQLVHIDSHLHFEAKNNWVLCVCVREGEGGGGASAGDIRAGGGQPCGKRQKGAGATGQTKVKHTHRNNKYTHMHALLKVFLLKVLFFWSPLNMLWL